MIRITKNISIDEKEIKEEFIRSSGPGGQNVNKVATAVQLRFNISISSLNEVVKKKLCKIAGSRLTKDGEIIISARRFRTREKNREDALERLILLINQASQKEKIRKKTKPTNASIKERLKSKQKRSDAKKQRTSDISYLE